MSLLWQSATTREKCSFRADRCDGLAWGYGYVRAPREELVGHSILDRRLSVAGCRLPVVAQELPFTVIGKCYRYGRTRTRPILAPTTRNYALIANEPNPQSHKPSFAVEGKFSSVVVDWEK